MITKDTEKTRSGFTMHSIMPSGTKECPSISKRSEILKFLTKELEQVLPPDDSCMSSMTYNDSDCLWPAGYSPWRHHLVSESEDDGSSKLSRLHGGRMVNMTLSATQALEKISLLDASRMTGTLVNDSGHKKMIHNHGTSLKCHRSSIGLLDLSDLHEVTQPIADSLSFPSIEWSFLDDGDNNDERDAMFPLSGCVRHRDDSSSMEEPHHAKRQCKGLLRSKQLPSNLYLLDNEHV